MLKKIPTSQVTLGMYLQSLEGSWLSHPFWKTKFVLVDAGDLTLLKASSVPAVWIDVSKGSDVEAPVPLPAAQPAGTAAPAPQAETPKAAAPAHESLESEIERAS